MIDNLSEIDNVLKYELDFERDCLEAAHRNGKTLSDMLKTERGAKADIESKLLSILCLIHRDGGHYTARHGLENSFISATVAIVNFISDSDSLHRLNKVTSV